MTGDETVRRLLDLEELKQLKARYFLYMDTKDWEAWRELFTDDLGSRARSRRRIDRDNFVDGVAAHSTACRGATRDTRRSSSHWREHRARRLGDVRRAAIPGGPPLVGGLPAPRRLRPLRGGVPQGRRRVEDQLHAPRAALRLAGAGRPARARRRPEQRAPLEAGSSVGRGLSDGNRCDGVGGVAAWLTANDEHGSARVQHNLVTLIYDDQG